jgi:phosphoglycerate-specific signal transduction histidine kinase
MNPPRREKIQTIITQLSEIQEKVEDLKDEEQESLDNMPEGLQYTTRYEHYESGMSCIEDALKGLKDAIEWLDLAKEPLPKG